MGPSRHLSTTPSAGAEMVPKLIICPSKLVKQPLRELNPLFDPSEGLVEGRFETGPPVRVPSANPSERTDFRIRGA